jgi:uncharacterized membrane protein
MGILENLGLEEEEIIELIMKLQADGVIKLENQATTVNTFAIYLKSDEAIWYWATIIIALITGALVFTISETVPALMYARNVLGVVFVLFLPGYSFVKAIFRNNMSSTTSADNFENIERFALSIGLSLALVSIVGLLLYYSPFGLNLNSVTPSLLAFTLLFATGAVIRDYRTKKTSLKTPVYAL